MTANRKIRRRIKKEKRIIFDCNALGYAAFFSYGDLEDDHGNPTAVIFGFLRLLLTLQEKLKGDEWVFCWDSRRSFRKEVDPMYKCRRGGDDKTDEELQARRSAHEQFITVRKKVIPALGFGNNLLCPGYEGDDLMAYLVQDVDVYENILVTSDNDMFQCLNDCDIYHLQSKKFFTSLDFIKKFGIRVEQWAEAKAIGGCTGDDVIGIQGVADPKKNTSKALTYLRGKLTKGKIKERIESAEGQSLIEKNRRLVTLPFKGDPPIGVRLGPNRISKESFEKVFEHYRFISLLEPKMFQRYVKAFKLKEKRNYGTRRVIRRRPKR